MPDAVQMPSTEHYTRWLWLILFIGLALRLAYALNQPTLDASNLEGADSNWYLSVGAGFFSGREHGTIGGVTYYNSVIPTPPLYILVVGFVQQLLSKQDSIVAIRLIQCLAATGTGYLVFRLATLISSAPRAGLFSAAFVAFHPALIAEPARIATETFYIFFLAMGLWLYVEYFSAAFGRLASGWLSPSQALALSAMAFGLATLTRAVSLLFPLGILLHLWLLRNRANYRVERRHGVIFLVTYIAIISTWTIHNAVLWNRIVIVSDQFMPALWRAAETEDGSPKQNDALLLDGADATAREDCEVDCKYQHGAEVYAQRIGAAFGADPGGYFLRQFEELFSSLAQPHGTTTFGEFSVREAAEAWASNNRSLEGLLDVLRLDGFAVKMAIWVFHLGGIALGTLGMFWSRDRWALSLPLIGFALYTLCAHFFLLALPRYLFPLEFIWLTFAGIAALELSRRWQARQLPGGAGS